MPTSATDSDLADLVADSFVPERPDAVRELFNGAGAPAPDVIWSPKAPDIRSALLRRFREICLDHMEDGRIPETKIDREDFGGLTEWLMILKPVEDCEDFEYLYYGSSVAESFGRDMTGRRTSEFGGHISTFFLGLYRAVCKRGEWVYSEHEPPRDVFVRVWQRLIVPLHDDDGEVSQIIVLNVPDNELRAGLELMVDPVFVLRADETIVYSNRAAQALFRLETSPKGQTLKAATGIALEISLSPEAMLAQHKVEDSVRLTIRDSIVERLVMTVSATQHRNDAFYVVVLRLIGT